MGREAILVKQQMQKKLDLAELRVRELESQLSSVYHFADAQLDKAGFPFLNASGVIVTLVALGGRQITPPFLIRNGLSSPTVESLRRDIRRSYEESVSLKPKGLG